MLIVIQCTIIMNAADQFYLYNRTSGPVVVRYQSSREMKELTINAGSQSFVGFNPQQMTVRTRNGMCSYFSGIGMNGIYSFLNILPNGAGVKLQFTGKSRQFSPVELTPITFLPDSVDQCSTPGSGVVTGKKSRHLKYQALRKEKMSRSLPLTVENLSKVPVTVEIDLGNESRVIELQPNGAPSSIAPIGVNQVVYNARMYSAANGSCTTINYIGMNPLFSRFYIDTDPASAGRFRVAYGRVGGGRDNRPLAWNGTFITPVIFEVSPNSSLGDSEYKASCWEPRTGDVFETAL